MRQIGSLPNEQQARRFEDYLLSEGIKASVEPDTETWRIWVLDEDAVQRSREAFEQFAKDPGNPRYTEAAHKAEAVREESEKREKAYRKQRVDVRAQWSRPATTQSQVTIGLIVLSIAVAVATRLGQQPEPWIEYLSIAPYQSVGRMMRFQTGEGFQLILSGQVWRLFTPMFIHFGFIHLLFNMLWLRQLGTPIEARYGSYSFLWLVLAISGVSNVGQYAMNHLLGQGSPAFGGMSGVVYGLFGFIWIKSQIEPESGFFMPRNIVVLMIGWFVICVTGAVGPIANTAHGVGLGSGMTLAAAGTFWHRLSGR